MKKYLGLLIFTSGLLSVNSWAAGGSEGWSMGANLGFINADQKDMNKEIDARTSATNAKDFGNAWEGNFHLTYRMAGGATALSFRPSYFYYPEESGTGAKYNVSGFTIFPMLKWFMLEDNTIKFYSQFGIGYGHISGEVQDGNFDVKFSGGNLGYMAGLGAEFCFATSHCLNVEGNLRFLSVDRMTVDSSSGSPQSGSKIDQSGKGLELELNGHDFATTMSGVLGMVGYTMYF